MENRPLHTTFCKQRDQKTPRYDRKVLKINAQSCVNRGKDDAPTKYPAMTSVETLQSRPESSMLSGMRCRKTIPMRTPACKHMTIRTFSRGQGHSPGLRSSLDFLRNHKQAAGKDSSVERHRLCQARGSWTHRKSSDDIGMFDFELSFR